MSDNKNSSSGEDQVAVKTILVVEDDEDIGAFIVQALTLETPYEALLVADGSQASKVVKTLKPSLFLLDYQLPDITGIKLYDQLHTTDGLEDIPAIIISANAPAKEMRNRKITHISKPFELTDLLQSIEKLLA